MEDLENNLLMKKTEEKIGPPQESGGLFSSSSALPSIDKFMGPPELNQGENGDTVNFIMTLMKVFGGG